MKSIILCLLLITASAQATIGLENHNPGNVSSRHYWVWKGAVGVDSWHHLIFRTDLDGLQAMRKVLRAYGRHGINNVSAIVNRWVGVPRNRDDLLAKRDYLLAVAKRVHVHPNTTLDMNDPRMLEKIAHALVYAENGSDPYAEKTYQQAFKSW